MQSAQEKRTTASNARPALRGAVKTKIDIEPRD